MKDYKVDMETQTEGTKLEVENMMPYKDDMVIQKVDTKPEVETISVNPDGENLMLMQVDLDTLMKELGPTIHKAVSLQQVQPVTLNAKPS